MRLLIDHVEILLQFIPFKLAEFDKVRECRLIVADFAGAAE
jgi:hypothetical protein